tara:strand:- start:2055 stop:2465 length:411 start_codon:yes stop_codon:yes gene_type:complete
MLYQKNIQLGKSNYLKKILIIYFVIFFNSKLIADERLFGKYVEIKILDKVNSQNSSLKLKIGEEIIFKNLKIKALVCKNSEFDDTPEITAYLQVKDTKLNDKDKVFVFNDWTFASSPSLKPFDHPIYDIWLTKCFN